MLRARLQDYYIKEGRDLLMKEFGYKNYMQAPKLVKIVVSIGVKEAVSDSKQLDKVVNELMLITGQKPVKTFAKKSIAAFKLREGLAIGCKVTLRNTMMYEFLDRLVNIALPRARDFKGFTSRFDGAGNFAFGLKEQIIFPEINYDKIDKVRGMNIVIVTTASMDAECKSLMKVFSIPFYN